jgi:two-component system, cell cycle sensor histidine kinase and response regulator CckA
LLDIATDAILVRDLDNKILFWNKGAERLYGWKAEEAIGKDVSQLLYKSMPSRFQKAQEHLMQTGEWYGELDHVTRDGKAIVVVSRWTLMRDEREQPKSILVVSTDVTEKKQLEAQFLRAQRMESIGTLASGIAHDLNNILTPILANAQLLQMRLKNLDDRSQRMLKTIEMNTKRGALLVQQVLSFARGVEGKHTVLQIKHVIREIQQIVEQTFPKFVTVQTEISKDLWTVTGNSTQLHQVLMNLCVNARDAMPEGGLLKITAENFFVNEAYARMNLEAKVGAYVLVTVSDQGTGIAPEIIDRIFEPFFTTKEIGKGTGLGLSTVIGIVKSHGGFVNVTSAIGKGTQFKLFLPAINAMEKGEAPEQPIPNGHGELILVVDDEAAIREVCQLALEAYDYRVLIAEDGIQAVAHYIAHKTEVNLVLVDMMMPAMDGATTIRTLQKINPRVKIIAASGLASSDQIAIAAQLGVRTFLPKPYTAEELVKLVTDMLQAEASI